MSTGKQIQVRAHTAYFNPDHEIEQMEIYLDYAIKNDAKKGLWAGAIEAYMEAMGSLQWTASRADVYSDDAALSRIRKAQTKLQEKWAKVVKEYLYQGQDEDLPLVCTVQEENPRRRTKKKRGKKKATKKRRNPSMKRLLGRL